MSIKKLNRECFSEFVRKLLSAQNVIAVQAKLDKPDCYEFRRLDDVKKLRLDYDVTLQPPKNFFQPAVETLLTYKMPDDYKSQYETEPFILLGVHPYDMAAINQMNQIFRLDNCDAHYFARRDIATIIAVDVVTPSKNVFASSMATAVVKEGYDILLTDIGQAYIAQADTQKGEKLLENAENATSADRDDLNKREQVWEKNKKDLDRHHLNCSPSELPALLERSYEHPVWEEKARTCFSCGSCNQVCPTCYCFNVQDDVGWDLKTGKRQRAWDGCLLDGFTKVAGGHKFRKNRADRFRHRLYRKGKYVPAKIGGQIACVGCGRCVGACLPDIANPVNVYNRLIKDIGIK